MNKLIKLLTILMLFFSFVLSADLEGQMPDRRLYLSSGYAEKIFNSNEALVYFPLSVMDAYSKLFDVATSDFNSFGAQLGAVLIDLPLSYWLVNSLMVPFHEFGHARFFKATGSEYSYGSHSYGRDFKVSNYWALSAIRLITPPFFVPGSGIAYCAGALNPSFALAPSLGAYWGRDSLGLVLSASGLNNQMLLADRLAESVYERGGHLSYLQHYVGNKLSGFVYANMDQDSNISNDPKINSSSDIGVIIKEYRNKGYDVTHRDLKMQSLLSLLSGTTFSLLRAYYNYFAHNNPKAEAAEYFGLRVPELNSYINARGLSFEIKSDYKIFESLFVGLGYEFVWKGDSTHNFSPRVRYNLAHAMPVLNEMWLSTTIFAGAGVGGNLKVDYAPLPYNKHNFLSRLGLFANLNIYNAKTLYGERNTTSLVDQKVVAPDFFAGLFMRY